MKKITKNKKLVSKRNGEYINKNRQYNLGFKPKRAMRLTKNEKKVLNLLLENAKITDASIAAKLKISSQAVGKIRKKLESTVIDSYSTNLNFPKIGIQTFAISLSKLTHEGLDIGELEVEHKLKKVANIIQIYRLPHSSATHIIHYGFQDIEELDRFFHSQKNQKEIFKYIENKEVFTFSHNSLLKNNPVELFKEKIEQIDTPLKKNKIHEIERFKKRLE